MINFTSAKVKEQEKFENKKKDKIRQVKQNANKVIEGRFPYYHRENLREEIKNDIPDLWTGDRVSDINVVNQFIAAVIDVSNQVEQEISNATIENIDLIDASEEEIIERIKE